MLETHEPINVWVYFKGTTIQPFLFFWQNRRLKIDTINLVHTSKHGSHTLYHFSVSSASNCYRLCFEIPTLKWFLEGVEEDNS